MYDVIVVHFNFFSVLRIRKTCMSRSNNEEPGSSHRGVVVRVEGCLRGWVFRLDSWRQEEDGPSSAHWFREIEEIGSKPAVLDESGLAVGICFYRLRVGSFVETKKLLVPRKNGSLLNKNVPDDTAIRRSGSC